MRLNTKDIDLTGKVALVTGGGRGLGRDMAQALAAAGAKVAVAGRNEEHLAETVALIQQAGGYALAITADVTEADAVERMVRQVEQETGPVDILVNNAGIVGVPGPMWEMDPVMWRSVQDVNVYGPFLCARAVLKSMVQRRTGRIINVASGAALMIAPFTSSYALSKAALLRLTECMAQDGQPYHIRVFAIDPGTVMTDMTRYLVESDEGKKYLPGFREWVLGGGAVEADLSARLVTRLASGQADALSGRFIQVHDDLDHLIQHAEEIHQQDLHTLRLHKLPEK